jgi:ketosteroid isomerase-like protein
MNEDTRSLVDANEAFYRAFRERDLPGMMRAWSTANDISVIHPGWEPLHGRGPVVESWQRILRNPASPQIQCSDVMAAVRGELGIVICTERVGGACLAATNVFMREAGAWRLVHHQAGAMPGAPRQMPAGRIH